MSKLVAVALALALTALIPGAALAWELPAGGRPEPGLEAHHARPQIVVGWAVLESEAGQKALAWVNVTKHGEEVRGTFSLSLIGQGYFSGIVRAAQVEPGMAVLRGTGVFHHPGHEAVEFKAVLVEGEPDRLEVTVHHGDHQHNFAGSVVRGDLKILP